ncbi:MAG: DUF4390 domain-containing protein [Deltaproteobacteria bacterium]|nr:DUF4390 domain-containing protein [Deltaproteobacteria bacterium]
MRIISISSKALRISVLAVLLMACVGSLWTVPARAEDARLADIVVTNTRDHLLLYFTVTDCFTENMKKAIDNGVVTTFTFFVNLNEVRNWWWDKKIADLKVSHEIKYDSLKKVYEVMLSSKDDKVVVAKDFDQAKRLMAEIVGLKVTELQNLHRGNRYQINMMAELDTIKLPFYFHYVFFFLSLWDFETDWYSVDFRY